MCNCTISTPFPCTDDYVTGIITDAQLGNVSIDFNHTCPKGAFITSIYGRIGVWLDALGPFVCSNGSILDATHTGKGGGIGGSLFSVTSIPPDANSTSAGFTGVSIYTSTTSEGVGVVSSISLRKRINPGRQNDEWINQGSSRGMQYNVACPSADMVIAGFYGTVSGAKDTAMFVSTLGITCRAIGALPGEQASWHAPKFPMVSQIVNHASIVVHKQAHTVLGLVTPLPSCNTSHTFPDLCIHTANTPCALLPASPPTITQ